MSEQTKLLRECRAALDSLLNQKSELNSLVCGSTTLGNLRAELYEYRAQTKDLNTSKRAIVVALDNLEDVLRTHCNENVVSVNVFINCQNMETTIIERTAESLKKEGISMRNLAGNFIG